MRQEILTVIANCIKEVEEIEIDISTITGNEKFEQLQINSIAFIKIVAAIEDAFGIEIDEDHIVSNEYDNIEEFLSYVEECINHKN